MFLVCSVVTELVADCFLDIRAFLLSSGNSFGSNVSSNFLGGFRARGVLNLLLVKLLALVG